MPEVFRTKGYRFFFFSLEGNEPLHVHVEKAENYAKLWLDSLAVARSRGFNSRELRDIQELVEENRDRIERKWHEHFGS